MITGLYKTEFQEYAQIAKARNLANMPDPAMFEVWSPLRRDKSDKSPFEQKMQQLTEREAHLNERDAELERQKVAVAEKLREANELAVSMGKMLSEMTSAKAAMMEETRTEMIDLAFAVAERIVLEKITRNPEIIANAISGALHEVEAEGAVEIHLNPADLQAIRKLESAEATELLSRPQTQWRSNVELNNGDIWIDTSHYRLDASLIKALKTTHADVIKQSLIVSAPSSTEETA